MGWAWRPQSESVLSGRRFYMHDTADAGSSLFAGDLAGQQFVKHTLKGRGLCCRFFLSESRRFYWFRAFEQATEEMFVPGRPEVETQDNHADYKCCCARTRYIRPVADW